MSSFFKMPVGPLPMRGMSISNIAVSQGAAPVLSAPAPHSSNHQLPWYAHYAVKPAVGGAVGYGLSSFLYPGVTVTLGGSEFGRNAFVAGAIFIGMIAAEVFRDKFWDSLPKGVSTVGSSATDVAIVAGIDYFAHILTDPSVATDLSKTKVLMEAAGAVIVASYVTNHFVLPWMGYDTSV